MIILAHLSEGQISWRQLAGRAVQGKVCVEHSGLSHGPGPLVINGVIPNEWP